MIDRLLVVLDPKEDYVADDRKIDILHSSVHHFAWSPDGKTIAFADDYNLYLIDPFGSSKEHLVKEDHFIRCISWSPDGRWVVYECLGIQAINVHDLRTQTISPYGRSPVWNPATNKIAFYINNPVFTDDPQVPAGVRIFDFNSGKTEIIKMDRDEIPFHSRNAVVWSPDGRALAFAMKKNGLFNKQPPAVYTLETGTKKFTMQVEGTHINDSAIKWSPDGTKIAVFLKEDGFTRILGCVCKLD